MRVHAMHKVPRFPWNWGTKEHHDAFRQALETRYAVLPYLYSLAHLQHLSPHPPMIHPASWNYPDDAGVLDKTYMIGNSIIAADLSTSHSPDANANSSTVILPKSTTWFLFNSTQTVQGNGLPLERENDLKLNEFPVYVVEGSLIPVHPWDGVVQHSQAQRGLLEIQVYAGADATFALHEDDGFSNDYATSGNVRVTSLIWDDANQLLKWNVIGGEKRYPNGNDYTEIRVALYEKDAKGVVRSGIVDINESGQIAMKEEGTLVG